MLRLRLPFQVARQSRLYESAPAYVTDQPRFVNAALAVTTALPPRELLAALKAIEVRLPLKILPKPRLPGKIPAGPPEAARTLLAYLAAHEDAFPRSATQKC